MVNKKIILDYRMMNAKQAKLIPLENILAQLGCKPTSQRGLDWWYHSPFRQESTASFKVNKKLNTWYDFGTGEGGTVIDFICQYYNETVKQALARLERSQYASMTVSMPTLPKTAVNGKIRADKEKKKGFTLDRVTDITEPALIYYINERKINLDIAKQYLKQVHFHYKDPSKQQYALGFKNDDGGYEMRNRNIKAFISQQHKTSAKTITSINIKDGNKLAVFEGFMDFLSYLGLYNITELKNSAVILNSTSLYDDCIKLLQKHQFSKVYFFLDNDKAGEDTLKKLTHDMSFEWVDKSGLYSDFEDFNAFLVRKNNNE